MVIQMLLLRTLLMLLKMISGISKLLLAGEAVEGRYPIILSFISFPDWRVIPWEGLKNKTLHLSVRCIGARVTHVKLEEA